MHEQLSLLADGCAALPLSSKPHQHNQPQLQAAAAASGNMGQGWTSAFTIHRVAHQMSLELLNMHQQRREREREEQRDAARATYPLLPPTRVARTCTRTSDMLHYSVTVKLNAPVRLQNCKLTTLHGRSAHWGVGEGSKAKKDSLRSLLIYRADDQRILRSSPPLT